MNLVVALTILLGPYPLDPAGFVCPDHTVVTTPDECPTGGNKSTPTEEQPPGSFPGGGGGGSGGGLLGTVGSVLHGLTGGLL